MSKTIGNAPDKLYIIIPAIINMVLNLIYVIIDIIKIIKKKDKKSKIASLEKFVEALSIADKVYLTDIDCNREKQSDYPGITSYTILDKIEGGELISNEDIYKLGNEKNQVVCFMSCAHTEDLIKSYKEYLDSIPKEEE